MYLYRKDSVGVISLSGTVISYRLGIYQVPDEERHDRGSIGRRFFPDTKEFLLIEPKGDRAMWQKASAIPANYENFRS
jgi:hypothetical protein